MKTCGLMVAFACVFLVSGCGQRSEEGTDLPVVVVSISPLAQLVSDLTEDVATVHTLLPAGVSPHGFSMTANQMQQISQADVIVLNGLGVDAWAKAGIDRAASADTKIIIVADVLGVEGEAHDCHDHDHHHDHNGPNPHFWLDPMLMKQFVQAFSQTLETRYPEQADLLRINKQSLEQKLDELDHAYRTQLADVPRQQMVTFHNAFDLLAERYGLEVVAHLAEVKLVGLSVTPGELRQARNAIEQYDLQVLYAEPNISSDAIKAVRERTGVDVLILDPLESSDKPYFEQMRQNLATLVKGQSMRKE